MSADTVNITRRTRQNKKLRRHAKTMCLETNRADMAKTMLPLTCQIDAADIPKITRRPDLAKTRETMHLGARFCHVGARDPHIVGAATRRTSLQCTIPSRTG